MEKKAKKQLSTESYKGVRDFYPEDMQVRNWIFKHLKDTVEKFGYQEYDASILEPSELYYAKTGEEIVNEQTYNFTDRGERKVTLRPEMTPTLARMVAAKRKDLPFPLRWYSIPNLFRYEKPQRGRLREHYQLNVDLLGGDPLCADIEILLIAQEILLSFGAHSSDFVIKLNNRELLNEIFEYFSISEENSHTISKLLDKKDKISKESFKDALEVILKERTEEFIGIFSNHGKLTSTFSNSKHLDLIKQIISQLEEYGVENVVFEPYLVRGFDYYTSTVFEIYDTRPENNRAIFGGGRYDSLLEIFDAEKVNAVGFGMGDVSLRDFLDVRNLIPKIETTTTLYICLQDKMYYQDAVKTAQYFRENNISVEVDISNKKIGDQIKYAVKKSIPFTVVIGEEEVKNNLYPLKNLSSRDEEKLTKEAIKEKLGK